MKIFIDNALNRFEGIPEQEIKKDAAIRFELNGYSVKISINEESNSLELIKTEVNTLNDQISIKPFSGNKIEIK